MALTWNSLNAYACLNCRIPIRSVLFHPTRPIMFICTSSHVYLYDLQRQCLVKKLFNGGQSMSCVAAHAGGTVLWETHTRFAVVHPLTILRLTFSIAGDNIIVGGSDGKLAWCVNVWDVCLKRQIKGLSKIKWIDTASRTSAGLTWTCPTCPTKSWHRTRAPSRWSVLFV